MARLELRGICKGWEYPVLDRLDLTVEAGEFFVVVGPSGISKSTLLKIVAGLEVPDAGEVIIGGKDVTKMPPYKRPVALTFESYALYPHRTVYRNIANPLFAQKLPKAEIERRVLDAARMLRIEHLLQRKPNEASGGQMQRISLARTLVKQPEVLLLDEPISHLDARIRYELRQQFHRIEGLERVATMFVTHDYTEALSLGHRVGVMGRGGLIQTGTPQEIYERPGWLFVAKHVGQPPINVIECRLNRANGVLHAVTDSGAIGFPVDEAHAAALNRHNTARVTVGIRPQHLRARLGDEDIDNRRIVEGKVDLYEPLGSMGVLIADVGGDKLTVITSPRDHFSLDQPVSIALRTEAFHYFNAETGANLVQ